MKNLTGKVISAKTKNTVTVETDIFARHKIYGKIVKKTKNYKADTNSLEIKEGNRVIIKSSKPLSKDKHWIIEKLIN
jgi:small subunit ribosomal protein S17